MAGEKKIIEMQLEYGVHPATSDSSGTATKLGPIRSGEYDSSVPLELGKAQAEALGNLANRRLKITKRRFGSSRKKR